MKKLLLFLATIFIAFVCAACEEEEDYDAITYYDVIGEGYVFAYDSVGVLQPVEGVEITITPSLEGSPCSFFVQGPCHGPAENYITDITGKYQIIHFIKRTYMRNTEYYFFNQLYYDSKGNSYISESYLNSEYLTLDVNKVKNAKNNIVILDTIKVYKK
jgi:hypothetical protein